jgi:hypothetical protein
MFSPCCAGYLFFPSTAGSFLPLNLLAVSFLVPCYQVSPTLSFWQFFALSLLAISFLVSC